MKTPRQKLRKELDLWFRKFIRQRDGVCQRCGTDQNLHASHVVPVSHGDRLRWDQNNAIALCYHDHLNWFHKAPLEASKWFVSKFPHLADYLEGEEAKGNKKWTNEELQEKLEFYKAQCK
jgi:5-methylcytosine-specific restriction endonuclease McrA